MRGEAPALACRLTEDHLLLLSLSPAVLRQPPDPQGQPVVTTDVTSAYAGFALVGPNLEALLRRLTHLDVRPAALPVNSCAETSLAGVEAVLVPTPELTLPALRVYVPWDLAEFVWERVLEAGRDLAITPLGLEGFRLLSTA
jgi:sarcosine oxidase subunit alpha